MSSPVTEILTLIGNDALKADPDLFFRARYRELVAEKTAGYGLISQAWGFRTDDPGTWQGFIDWPTIQHHKNVSPKIRADKEFMDTLHSLVDNLPKVIHVPFAPFDKYKKAIAAPSTEIIFTRMKDGADVQEFKNTIEYALETSGAAEGCLSGAWGCAAEDEKVAVLVMGWESREAHVKFEATQGLKDVIERFSKVGSVEALVHVKFQ